jgi:D-3-phosphoglycerate dehydrogenase / 2-oxoglutarate reductase
MMATARNVTQGCANIKDGKWERNKYTGVELKGKTLAIVGAGKGELIMFEE